MTATAARDLHVGDAIRHPNWTEHVTAVDVVDESVAFVVREFPTTLQHRAGGDMLDIEAAL